MFSGVARLRSAFTWMLAALAVAACGMLAWGTWCAITNFYLASSGDYVRYVTMLWNTSRGDWFQTSEGSYLYQHLSFSLALLSLVYRVADHALSFAWFSFAFTVGGGLIVAAAARRAGVSWTFVWGLLLYWFGYHFMQEIQMAGFHTVTAYLVLIPLLYWAVLARRNVAIAVVLALILGLREEAGLMVVPLLLWFAVKERWKAGYIFAGAALGYVALASLVLYPAINEVSLFTRRQGEIGVTARDPHLWQRRMVSLFWILLPIVPLLPRGWRPFLVIPSVAILTSLLSMFERQYTMRLHYPSVIMATLAVAALEALRGRKAEDAGGERLALLASAWLLVVTCVSYFTKGLLPGSPERRTRTDQNYKKPGKAMRTLDAARLIPQDASVGAETAVAGFVANRKAILWNRTLRDPKLWTMDYIFTREQSLSKPLLHPEVIAGNYELLHHQDGFVILKRRKPSEPVAN